MTPKEILSQYWGHNEFRKPQEDIIDSVLNKNNTIALLPTGGGKSICYQIPAVILDGIALVISPLISLMQDQVQNLKSKGIKATYIKSGTATDDIVNLFDNIKFDETKLLYLSPERLQSKLILDKLKQANISFIAVDEAHCISEWGHDFRPSYLSISDVKKQLRDIPVIAVTASANERVLKDIQIQLEIENTNLFKKSFKRNNLAYQIFKIEDKNNRLLQIVSKMKSPIIVYTNTRKRTQEISSFLVRNGFDATFYHGGLSKDEKDNTFKNWMSEKKRIIVATNAFGMGIDKENVGVVIHMDIPYSIENYFQEAGRAGRNGKKSFAALLWNASDIAIFQNQLETNLPDIKFIKECTKKLYQSFEIANGELSDTIHDFDFFEFCNRYNFQTEKVKNTLHILNSNGVLEISKDFYSKSLVKILVNPNQLQNQIKSQEEKSIIEFLLRSYTGLFSEYTKINEFVLVSKIKITSNRLRNILISLDKKEILSYKQNKGLQSLHFLKPREDKYGINQISKEIKAYLNQKKEKADSLLKFIQSSEICRSQKLLDYFDEQKSDPCGICDLCLEKKNSVPEDLEVKILDLLSKRNLNSQEIFLQLKTNERWVLESLKNLLKKEKVRVNFQNQYIIND